MYAIATSDDVIAHFAALHDVISDLADERRVASNEYSLDHLDAVSALIAATCCANKVVSEPIRTMTGFHRFTSHCKTVANIMGFNVPHDKCIHQITAFLCEEILADGKAEIYGGYTDGEGPTIN